MKHPKVIALSHLIMPTFLTPKSYRFGNPCDTMISVEAARSSAGRMVAVRQAILLVPALALAACSSGQPGDHVPDQTVSPGSVTFSLLLPSTREFCDQLPCTFGTTHLSINNALGQPFQLSPGLCPTFCSAQCREELCPRFCPISGGVAATSVQVTWDGSYYESSTCGSGTSCYDKRFVHAGHYVAFFCATPGTLNGGDTLPTTCAATGPQECAEVQFMIPSSAVVVASLPDAAP